MKSVQYLILLIFLSLFSSCGSRAAYHIEGEVSNINDSTIYAVFEKEGERWIDTIVCESLGEFEILEDATGVESITLYFEDRTVWCMLYPEFERKIQIKGDILYPSLFQIKGSKLNEQLTKYGRKNESLLKEFDELKRRSYSLTSPKDYNEVNNKLTELTFQLEEIAADYVKTNPKDEMSILLIEQYFANAEDTRQMDELLAVLDPDFSLDPRVIDLLQYSARVKRTMLGAEAPNFNVVDIYQKPISLDSFPDKYVLLTFSAPWCEMCGSENTILERAITSLPKDTIEMLIINLSNEQCELDALMKNDSTLCHFVLDSAGQSSKLLELYDVNAVPLSFLIDRDRKILVKSEIAAEMTQALDKIFKE